ncbi:hypothetical protein HQ393_12345 [Chitinibacter bivalviorum]|uniref:Uncharacterized protein n=1 Tax=Chitinibacter bivalviorum TaxID=2739434 RepID=A0A7H9BKQ9_9NEIS|nr:hypothetical protein [Chitinibacter bivalviorum]QLG88962.1 hypothetical protein HQ393_12345 [Chitinibacter bivalviorum]
MQFNEILPQHFSTISRDPFPHVLIERALLQMAEGQLDGPKFRNQVLHAAGWKHSNLTSFGKYPEEAAAAFNRLRLVMAEHETPTSILEALKH